MEIPVEFSQRQVLTETRLTNLDGLLRARQLDDRTMLKDACIYATGSVGRGEASAASDLDVFLLDGVTDAGPSLGNIDQIRVKARLVEASNDACFPPFSGDGQYLVVHDVGKLLRVMGSEQDDASNFFTARMLLLLESRCLAGRAAYDAALSRIIDRYWLDWCDHEDDFLPVYLVNDLVRFWKTLCVNYEARRHDRPSDGSETFADWLAKRRLENLKLGFSRLWRCHTGLAFVIAAALDGPAVARDVALDMAATRPVDRLASVAARDPRWAEIAQTVLDEYAWFLRSVDMPKSQALEWITDDAVRSDAYEHRRRFGEAMYELVDAVARTGPLHRFLVA